MKKYIPLFIILTGCLLYSCFQLGVFPFPLQPASKPVIIAHRGVHTHAAENSLQAFELALQSDSGNIELDVRSTKDEIPVVFHDKSLKRLFSVDRHVEKMTVTELKKLTANLTGAENSSDSPVCTLEEVLRLCCINPQAQIHLDLKTSGTEKKVVSLLKKYDYSGQYEVTSKNPSVLKKVKTLDPSVRTFLLISTPQDLSAYKYDAFLSFIQNGETQQTRPYIDGISVRSSLLSASVVRRARRRNQYIYVWTVNTGQEIRRMCHLGVDGIITDNPSYVHDIIYSDH